MSRSARVASLFLVLALAVAGLAVAGCGKTVIDDVKTEEALEENVESSLGKKVKSVDCPSDVEVEAKATFECTVTLVGGDEETAELRIINDDADVEVVDLSASGGDQTSDAGE